MTRKTDTLPFCYTRLKKAGYKYQRVERYDPRRQRSKDFGGFGDILAWCAGDQTPDPLMAALSYDLDTRCLGVLAIQSTTLHNLHAHIRKVCENPEIKDNLTTWLLAGNRFEIWAWHKTSPRNPDGSFLRNTSGQKSKVKVWEVSDRRFTYESGELWTYDETEISVVLSATQPA